MKIHPVAEMFPMMTEEELDELAADIKANGLLNPITKDNDDTLIDGRNRLEACSRAGVEPKFETLNGTDPVAYILAQNVKRRHLSKGQQAMAVVLSRSQMEVTSILQKEQAGQLKISEKWMSHASVVLEHARELAPQVLSGALALDKAYETAVANKKAGETEAGKMEQLRLKAADLHSQVTEGTLSLAEAIGALDAREKEKAIAEKDAQDQRVERANNLHMILGTLAIGPTDSDVKAQLALDVDWPTFAFMNKGISKKDWLKAAKTISAIAKLWDDDYANH
jgi:ParB-like chromosome segregation protein Spo0J